MSEPTCISPSSIRLPPNQINATLDTLMTRVVTGSINACHRPIESAVSDRAWLASAKRSRSSGSRANARITRIPDNCSRSTRLMPSISHCMRAEQRQQVRHDPVVGQAEHRHADHQQPGQPGVLMHGHHDAADAHDRRRDQHGARHLHEQLDLLNVVGGAGEERRRAEPGGLLGRQARHVVEDRRAHVAAEPHARARSVVDRPDRAQHLQRGDAEHDAAKFGDGAGVTLGHPVVDDLPR